MEIKKGLAVCPGLAIAPALVLDAQEFRISQRRVSPSDTPNEVEFLHKAIEGSITEITQLREQFAAKHGEETARIFDFHLAILTDQQVRRRMEQAIMEQAFSAAYAVSLEMRRHVRDFLESNEQYFSERVKDVYDVERRLLRHLVGGERKVWRTLRRMRLLLPMI